MTSRVAENQVTQSLVYNVIRNRDAVNKFSNQIASGRKVVDPGDSNQSGTIAQFQDTLKRIEGYKDRVSVAQGYMSLQDEALGQAAELLVRAKEVASQGANETNSEVQRAQLAEEIFEIREHMVGLANTTYQGRYIYAGAADDNPAFSRNTDYTEPAAGGLAAYRYTFNSNDGSTLERSVQVTEDLTVKVNTTGSTVFNNAIQALDRLGRALAGYRTEPATGTPDGSGTAFTFPTDFNEQTTDIKDAIDLLDTARQDDVMTERTNLAGRMRRLQTAQSLLELSEKTAKDVLAKLVDTDMVEAATDLTEAQTALQASLTVSTQIMRLSILNYI